MSIPDTTKRILAYQERACEISARLRVIDEEATEHLSKGQLDRAHKLLSERKDLVREQNSAYASIKQLKAHELLTGVTPRRRKTDQVLR